MKIKWKKIFRKAIVIPIILLLLGIIFANIDYSRTKKNKPPIIAIYVGKNKYTEADIYWGLGYRVVKCPQKQNNKTKYQLYFLDAHHVCVYSYDVEVSAPW
jgi:hypothetical protein